MSAGGGALADEASDSLGGASYVMEDEEAPCSPLGSGGGGGGGGISGLLLLCSKLFGGKSCSGLSLGPCDCG